MEAINNNQPKQNSEVVVSGNKAAVFTTDPEQVAVSCFVDWSGDKLFIRRKVYKTRAGAEKCAQKFFAGLR